MIGCCLSLCCDVPSSMILKRVRGGGRLYRIPLRVCIHVLLAQAEVPQVVSYLGLQLSSVVG
jgi:hypothetical protein